MKYNYTIYQSAWHVHNYKAHDMHKTTKTIVHVYWKQKDTIMLSFFYYINNNTLTQDMFVATEHTYNMSALSHLNILHQPSQSTI